MMKKLLLCGVCAMIVACVTSCKDDEVENIVVNPMELNVSLPSDQPTVWKANSNLGLFFNNAVHSLAVKEGLDTKKASFLLDPSIQGNIYVCYPYVSAMGTSLNELGVSLPNIQSERAENSFYYGEQNLSVSSSIDVENAFSILDLNISSDGYGVGNALSSVTVTSENAALAGDFTVDLATGEIDLISGQSESVTYNFSAESGLLSTDSPVKASVVINPVQLEGKTLTIEVKMGEETWTFNEGGLNYEANKVYPISLMIGQPPINLNEKGYANSYIVDKPNTLYKFDAKVQGNGEITTGIEPQVINPKSVFVVWESTPELGGVIKNVELTDDGFVTFSTSGVIGGNALIAVTDGVPTDEFPRGTILWSWHIWSTNYSESDDILVSVEGNTFAFMSKNLGALGTEPDAEGMGLKYQWGRKDPFYKDGILAGGEVTTGAVTDEMYGWQASSYIPEEDGSNKSLEASIMFPTAFFLSNWGTSYDWYGVGSSIENRNNNLWGNPDGGLGTKTIYDPCPVGYRVPSQDAFKGISSPVSENNAFTCVVGDQTMTFPASSYLVETSGVLSPGSASGTSNYYWTTNTSSQNVVALKLETSWGSVFANLNSYCRRGWGAAVRCIRE